MRGYGVVVEGTQIAFVSRPSVTIRYGVPVEHVGATGFSSWDEDRQTLIPSPRKNVNVLPDGHVASV
jgi:hypothetical protein